MDAREAAPNGMELRRAQCAKRAKRTSNEQREHCTLRGCGNRIAPLVELTMRAPRKLSGLFVPGAQRGDFLAQGAQALRALFGRKGDLPKDGGYGLRVVFRRYGKPINPENRFLLIEAPLLVQGKQHLV